jgi:MinD-like ATPase involved in chromosome partitioning or flagellar assembly
MAPEKPKRQARRRKLGRGLSEVSHIFLSGAEKAASEAKEGENEALWMPDASLISVTSGEKIRGKTFLTANLAFGLSAHGRSVAIVNADSEKPDILDVTGAIRRDDGEGLALSCPGFGGLPIADVYGVPRRSPVETLPGGSGTPSAGEAIEAAARHAQSVLIDTSPWAEASRIVWKRAELTLIICKASSEGMRASYVTIKRVRAASPAGRIGLIVNMAASHADAYKCFRKVSDVCRRFLKTNIRNYGYIVDSDAVAKACEKAMPLVKAYPESRIAKCIFSVLKLIMMDESAIAKRRREVTADTCALKEGR